MTYSIDQGLWLFTVAEPAMLCRLAELDPVYHPHGKSVDHMNHQLSLLPPAAVPLTEVHFVVSTDHVEYLVPPMGGFSCCRCGPHAMLRQPTGKLQNNNDVVGTFHQALAVAGYPGQDAYALPARGDDVALAMEVRDLVADWGRPGLQHFVPRSFTWHCPEERGCGTRTARRCKGCTYRSSWPRLGAYGRISCHHKSTARAVVEAACLQQVRARLFNQLAVVLAQGAVLVLVMERILGNDEPRGVLVLRWLYKLCRKVCVIANSQQCFVAAHLN